MPPPCSPAGPCALSAFCSLLRVLLLHRASGRWRQKSFREIQGGWRGWSPAWLRLPRGYRAQGFTESTWEGAQRGQSSGVLHCPAVSDTAFGAADGGDSLGTLRRGRLGPASASLRAAASEKKGFQGHSYFLGSRERQEMFPARSQEIGADPCLQQEGCGAAGAGEVFSIHLR